MKYQTLRELGWQPHFEQQLTPAESDQLIVARVTAHHGGQILLQTLDGEIAVPTASIETDKPTIRSNTRTLPSSIAVGDWYLLNKSEDHRAVRRLERRSVIQRKAAGDTVKPQLICANVDTVFIVSSCNQDFNLSRIERFLAIVLESKAVPIVVLTKSDLADDSAMLRKQVERLHRDLIVETLDARDELQTSVLEYWCGPGKTIAMLGSSGVGKSTLANTLGGFDIKTSGIREDDDKGRHTTTARSMHRLKAGGWLIDSPGMREFQLPACEQGVEELFQDVLELAQHCKFRNCRHQGDSGCAIETAIETGKLDSRRLTSFLKLQSEQARNSASLAERREKDRKQGQFYKSVIKEKQSRRKGF